MLILGIETSCDETAAAVLEEKNGRFLVRSSVISSQVKLHKKWGGVVPNLAAREHLKNIAPVISESLENAGVSEKKIDLIAVTAGPGLIPALLIGNMAAKTLSWLWKKPLIGINHIEGHIYANFISNEIGADANFQISNLKQTQNFNSQNKKRSPIKFPLLCLVVSGGHTQLVLMKNHLQYEVVGETLDDAAGEAFDKVARILGLEYPGGPAIALQAKKFAISKFQKTKLEKKGRVQMTGSENQAADIILPRPMINSKDLNFSFSGLKTAVLYLAKRNQELLKNKLFIQEVSSEFQQAVIDVLISKTLKAAKKYSPKTISLAGGVSANTELRKQLGKAIEKHLPKINRQIPETKYSLDNAAMIAAAAYFRQKKEKSKLLNNWKKLEAQSDLLLD